MASEEVTFLRDQVQRLNAVLAEYQEKYPPLGIMKQDGDVESPDIPWVVDKSLMSPLLAEYDANLQLMKGEVEAHKSEQKDLRCQVDKLVAENKRLTRELKDSVQNQLTVVDPGASVTDGETLDDDQVLQNLQYQLQMALQEKDSAMEMWQAAVQEVERLEKQVQNQQYNPQLHSLEKQALQIKDQYVKTVAELNTEITALQEELRGNRNELKISKIQVTELRKTLEEMRNQMIRQDQEKTYETGSKEMATSRATDLQKHSLELHNKLEEAKRDLEEMEKEKTDLEEQMLELQKKVAEQEVREYEATLKVRGSVQMVENALLEKDEAIVREKQARDEIERLQKTLSVLVDEAGARTRKEVDSVKQQCNNNISKLMEEIHTLELENSEKQAQIDRAIREKRAVESELEKLYNEGIVQGSKESNTYNELNSRACEAERLRDEATIKMEQMDGQMRRMEMTLRQEKSHLNSEMEQLKDRLSLMNQEFESANDDRVRCMEKIDELKRKLQKEQQGRETAQRNLNKEVTCMEHDMQLKQKEMDVKVQSLEDSHRHATNELRQLLASNQRMCAKWKEECQTITRKFETKVNEIRSDLSREKKRNGDLTKLLKEARDKTADAEQMLTEYTRNIKRLEDRVRDAEHRASTATVKVSRSLRKERDIVDERRQLKRELERSIRESQIQNGSDPLGMSDLASSYHKPTVTLVDGVS